jgi:hypothetical protein
LQTILSQTAVMVVFVTAGAVRGKSEEGPAEVLDFDRATFTGRNMLRRMALGAGQSGMLAFKSVAGLFVVKGLDVPFNEGEIFSIVIGMAARAFLARFRLEVEGRMQAAMGADSRAYFRMTICTTESWAAEGKLVARSAIAGATERLVRTSQRPGRNLSVSGSGKQAQPNKCDKKMWQSAAKGQSATCRAHAGTHADDPTPKSS